MIYNRHYCYRIDFADGFVYFGSRTCQCSIAADSYIGSPTTHKAKWLTDTPRVKTIVSVHATRQLANEAEAKLISDFWAVSGKELSLNAAVCGAKFHMQGVKHTTEAKAKIRQANERRKRTAESKAKTSRTMKGRPGRKHTDETKAKLSEARQGKPGKPHTAEAKAKISNANTGKKHTDEAKAKQSESKKRTKWYTNELVSLRLQPHEPVPEGFRLGRPSSQAKQKQA